MLWWFETAAVGKSVINWTGSSGRETGGKVGFCFVFSFEGGLFLFQVLSGALYVMIGHHGTLLEITHSTTVATVMQSIKGMKMKLLQLSTVDSTPSPSPRQGTGSKYFGEESLWPDVTSRSMAFKFYSQLYSQGCYTVLLYCYTVLTGLVNTVNTTVSRCGLLTGVSTVSTESTSSVTKQHTHCHLRYITPFFSEMLC